MTVHFKPIGTDQILLIEDSIVGTQEPKILELKCNKKGKEINFIVMMPELGLQQRK